MNYVQDSPPIPSGKKPQQQSDERTIGIYSVQCAECFKWRLIPSEEEFEEIRSTLTENPFICKWKPNTSCDDPADIECDASRTWVIDKPDIPKTPKGFKRKLVLRRDYSKIDAYFVTPTGKRVKGPAEIAAYLESNDVKDVSVSDFHFATPKIIKDTIPEHVVRENLAKKMKSPF
ncbi:hypothetical protein QQ045_027061 [Rhodiola kirilowii]